MTKDLTKLKAQYEKLGQEIKNLEKPDYKVGDWVYVTKGQQSSLDGEWFFKEGDVVQLSYVVSNTQVNAKSLHKEGIWRLGGPNSSTFRPATPDEIHAAKEALKPQYKVGDWVEVIEASQMSHFRIGQICQVEGVSYIAKRVTIRGLPIDPRRVRPVNLDDLSKEQLISILEGV